MTDFTLNFCDLSNGERLSYVEVNPDKKDKVVLVHGNLTCWNLYRELLENPKFNDHHLIAVDARGYGSSSYNQKIETHYDFATDLALFAKKLNIEKASWAGTSTGGGMILALAIQNPELVSNVILVDSIPIDGLHFNVTGENGLPDPTKFVSKREEVEKSIAGFRMMQTLESENLHPAWNTLYVKNAIPPLGSKRWEELRFGITSQKHFEESMWANIIFNITNGEGRVGKGDGQISKIKCPVVFIHGEKDPFITLAHVKDVASKYMGHIEHKIHMIPDCGHMALLEDLETFSNFFLSAIKN